MKIHGVSRTPEGELLFAVSFAKAKSFYYIRHEEMVAMYPNYLIGFYERSLQFGPVADVKALVAEDVPKTEWQHGPEAEWPCLPHSRLSVSIGRNLNGS
jgi:hypothetical protein